MSVTEDKLNAAIYIIHELTRNRYAFGCTEERGRHWYNKAMKNYMDIIDRAGGPSAEANQAEVARGFHITQKERDYIVLLEENES